MACPRTTAFSLIELLVVISIIAILASMVFSGVEMARAAARKSVCSGNLRQILAAATAYSLNWEGYQVPAYIPGDTGPGNAARHWGGFLQGYLDCDAGRTTLTAASDLKPLVCPESPRRFGFGHNFAANGIWNNGNAGLQYFVISSQIVRPSDKVYFVDSIAAPLGQAVTGAADTGDFACWRPYVNRGSTNPPAFTVHFAHRSAADVAFVDGHVAPVGRSERLIEFSTACDDRWWLRQ